METFDEYRRRRIDEAGEMPPGEQQASTIQQQPEPAQAAEDPSMLAGALQGMGLGLVVSYLGFKGLQKAKRALALAGYGRGKDAFIRFAKHMLPKSMGGAEPYAAHKYTPEEQQTLAKRLTQIVGGEKATLDNSPAAGMPRPGVTPPERPNPLLAQRTDEFATRLFDVAKTPKRAMAALTRIMPALSAGNEVDPTDQKTVLAALASGSASKEFKQWFYEKAVSSTQIDKTLGRGKDKRQLNYTKYDMGKLPLTKVDLASVVKFFRSLYGERLGPAKPAAISTPPAPSPGASDLEKAARDTGNRVTADAMAAGRLGGGRRDY